MVPSKRPIPKFQPKNIVLTNTLNGVMYELMVKTTADMVYFRHGYTLTEKMHLVMELFARHQRYFREFHSDIERIFQNTSEITKTLEDVWKYVNINGDPKSELIKLIESKQDAEEGKGLSECDFTSVLKDKLEGLYTNEQIDDKIRELERQLDPSDIKEAVEQLEEKYGLINQQIESIQEDMNSVKGEISDIRSKINVICLSDDAENPDVQELVDGSLWYLVVNQDG